MNMLKRSKPGRKTPNAWKYRLFYWVTIGAGIAFCFAAYAYFKSQVHRRMEAELSRCVSEHVAQLQGDVVRYEQQLRTLRVLFDYSDGVTRDEFQGAARELHEWFRDFPVFEWAPRVTAAQRSAFEAGARSQDLPGFEFKELDERGQLVRARDRAEYLPVYYLEPLAGNNEALGFDLKTGRTLAELERARDTGLIVSSGVIPLVQDSAITNGWIMIMPLYHTKGPLLTVEDRRQNLAGYVQGVFRVEELFENAWGGNSYSNSMELLALDVSSNQVPKAIYRRSSLPPTLGIEDAMVAEFQRDALREVSVSILERRWKIYFKPTREWRSRQRDWYSEAFFIAGLFLVGLVSVNLASQQRRSAVVERLVDLKAAQWRQINQELQRQVEEQRKTRSELEESQKNRLRLAAAVDQASEMILFCDERGAIRYVNPAFIRLTGFLEADILGKSFEYCQMEKQPGTSFEEISKRVAETGVWRGGFRASKKNGECFDADVTVSPVRDPSTLKLHYILLARDVTNERQLEEQVRLSQKMEAIGLLAGGVAHDFNNLLQVIQGYASLAMEQANHPAEQRESLDQVQGASERASRLTRQLLAFGRRQALQKEDVDLGVLIGDLLHMIRRIIGEHIEIDLIPGHQLGNVRADRSQIEQVVLNLCVNARDAMPKGGRLTIELENVLINGSFRESHPWAKPGHYVLMSIIDNGVGMDKATQTRIFEPFFTTKSKEHGTGLGLSVVYGIIKQHDGMVHVYSEPGLGSTFKVYLPVVERAAAVVGHKLAVLPGRGHETIMLVEDEVAVRTLAAKVLERAGYRVLLAADGLEACQVFSENAAQISLVLLDVVMPRMGGREACEKISAMKPGIPVIYCSGYSEGALHGGFELPDGIKLIQKPYAPDELLRHIRSTLDGG
jgi:PAS domain S-box-containing protein